jgi:ankyrin repeat protein
MDTLSVELLLAIARHLDISDLLSWLRTAKRYNLVLIDEVYSKAVEWDERVRGHPIFLLRAALRNQVEAFRGLLQRTKDVRAVDIPASLIYCPHPWDPRHRCYPLATATSILHVLCHFGRLELARLALAKGADPAGRDSQGRTPLHIAIGSGQAELPIVKLLIDAGADVNARKDFYCRELQTALQIAVAEGCLDIVQTLLEAGASASVCTTTHYPASPGPGRSVLSLAAHGGDARIFQCIIDKTKPPVRVLTEALVAAVDNNDTAAAQLLLDSGAPIAWRVIVRASSQSRLPMMKFLIKSGADICQVDDDRRNLLWVVQSHRAAEILLNKSPSLAAGRERTGQTCLDYHLTWYEGGDHALVARLLEYGADFNPYSKGAKLAFHTATKKLDLRMVSRMLAKHPCLFRVELKRGLRRCATQLRQFHPDPRRRDKF